MDSLLSLMSFSLSAPYLAGPAAGAAYGSVPVRDSSRTSTGSSGSAMGYRVSMASSRLRMAASRPPWSMKRATLPSTGRGACHSVPSARRHWIGYNVLDSPMRDE